MLHCYVSAIKDIKNGANLTNFLGYYIFADF